MENSIESNGVYELSVAEIDVVSGASYQTGWGLGSAGGFVFGMAVTGGNTDAGYLASIPGGMIGGAIGSSGNSGSGGGK